MMMSPQNNEIVVHDGRYDLPFVLCMFGRHGPAVALLIALLLALMGLFSISRKVLALIKYLKREAKSNHMKKDSKVLESTELSKSDMQVPRLLYGIGDTRPEKRAGYIPNRNIKVFSQKQQHEDTRDHGTMDSINFDFSNVHGNVTLAIATDYLHPQPQINEIHDTENNHFNMEPHEKPTVENTTGLSVGNVKEMCLDKVDTQAEEIEADSKKGDIGSWVILENFEHITDGNNLNIPGTDLSVLSWSQDKSTHEYISSEEPHQDCSIISDIISPFEEVPEGPDVHIEQNTVNSQDVIVCKSDSSDVYSTVPSAMDRDIVHQQAWIHEETLITDYTHSDKEQDKESPIERTTRLSEGNVEERCLNSVEMQPDERGECGKNMELYMAVTLKKLSGPLCVESQSHPEPLTPTKLYDEGFMTRAADHEDTNTHTAEVANKMPNKDVLLNVQNTEVSSDTIEHKCHSSDSDTDTHALFSGHLPQTVDQREEDMSVFDNSEPGIGFEESRMISTASGTERSGTQSLTGAPVPPSLPQEDSGPAGFNVIPGSDSFHHQLSIAETQKSQLSDISEIIGYGSGIVTRHSSLVKQPTPFREGIHITDIINIDKEIDEEPTVENTTGFSVENVEVVCFDNVEAKAEAIEAGSNKEEIGRRVIGENIDHIRNKNNQSISLGDLSVLSFSQKQSPPEQHIPTDPYQDCLTTSDTISPSEKVADGPEDNGSIDPITVTSEDVVYKTDSSDIYTSAPSAMDTAALHQQPLINEDIPKTEKIHFTDKKEDEEPTVEHTNGLSKGNVEEQRLDNDETQPEEMGECGKKMELDATETITKAGEDPDTNTHSAEVTDKKPNEDKFINFHNASESTDVIKSKSSSSDFNNGITPAIDNDSPLQQPRENEESQVTDKFDINEEPDKEPTVTTDTCTRIRATENSHSFEDENADTIVSVSLAKVPVSFRVQYFTPSPGQNLAVTGNHEELGNWSRFFPLEEKENGYWIGTMHLPSRIKVQWKFVVVDDARKVQRWEECDNRLLETGIDAHSCLHLHKCWAMQ